jgi:hypothetical protein
MIEILTFLALTLPNIMSEAVTTNDGNGLPLGYLVIGIIALPVIVLISASLLGKPKSFKITTLFLGWLFMMLCVFIVSVFGLSFLLGIFF